MSISTAGTILKSSATQTGTYVKVIDIVTYPDMGSSPSKLDSTTLTALKIKTSILGLQDVPDLTFETNYTLAGYNAAVALEGSTIWFHLEFGTDGIAGKFEWSGKISTFVTGGGVDEVRKMTVTTSAETEIEEISA